MVARKPKLLTLLHAWSCQACIAALASDAGQGINLQLIRAIGHLL